MFALGARPPCSLVGAWCRTTTAHPSRRDGVQGFFRFRVQVTRLVRLLYTPLPFQSPSSLQCEGFGLFMGAAFEKAAPEARKAPRVTCQRSSSKALRLLGAAADWAASRAHRAVAVVEAELDHGTGIVPCAPAQACLEGHALATVAPSAAAVMLPGAGVRESF